VYNDSGHSWLAKPAQVAATAAGYSVGGPLGAAAAAAAASSDIFIDLLECLTDKAHSTDLDQFRVWMKRFSGVPQEKIEKSLVASLASSNPATGSLLGLLLRPGFEKATLVAHSQGNIITCNAVNAVAALRGSTAISEMRVFAIASPVMFWSEAGKFGRNIVQTFAFRNDLVAWLGANFDDPAYLVLRGPVARKGTQWHGSEVSERYARSANPGNALTHNFYAYLEYLSTRLRHRFP